MSNFNSINSDEYLSMIFNNPGAHVRFTGIYGAGMLPLACLFKKLGYNVSGSDRMAGGEAEEKASAPDDTFANGRRLLRELGVKVTGHGRDYISSVNILIYSLAVSEDNEELLEAKGLGIPMVSRAEALGYIMRQYREGIAVSGTHGKSTTVAITDAIFTASGRNPTTVSGATLCDGNPMRIGGANSFICEACEYKDSFLRLSPSVAVVTGIELDHTDYFKDTDAVCASFSDFINKAKCAVLNIDSENVKMILPRIKSDVITFGALRREAAVNAKSMPDYCYNIRGREGDVTSFDILKGDDVCLTLDTELPGEYNISNITAAAVTALECGIERESIENAVREFHGIDRRFSKICTITGRDVIYDYAHHPSELSSVIDAANERYGECTVIFRPHTFTRTESLWSGFVTALSKPRFTIIGDIYPAREEPMEGINAENLAKAIGDNAVYLDEALMADYIIKHTSGAILLLGASPLLKVKADLIKHSRE